VRSGSSLDVTELDAASRRRLDDMRELLSSVALASPGRRKLYIVDEVHQLTADAAALLKTLEEPPSHVVFVLATTEPEAVPETVRSRCQHFSFGLLNPPTLSALVRAVAEDANLALSAGDLAAAVAEGAGSARDALSALERIALGGSGQPVVPTARLAQALAQHDSGAILAAVAEATAGGFAPRQIAQDLLACLRQAFLSVLAPSLVATDDSASQALARQMGLPYLVRAMEALGRARALRISADPRASLEVTLLACAAPPAGDCLEGLVERVERLEAALGPSSRPGAVPPALGPVATGPLPSPEPAPSAKPVAAEALAPLEPATSEPAALGTAGARDAMARLLGRVQARHLPGTQSCAHPGAPGRLLDGSLAPAAVKPLPRLPDTPGRHWAASRATHHRRARSVGRRSGNSAEPASALRRGLRRTGGTGRAVRAPLVCARGLGTGHRGGREAAAGAVGPFAAAPGSSA
jgi:DNA polymerase-3 subunit gamma/tau